MSTLGTLLQNEATKALVEQMRNTLQQAGTEARNRRNDAQQRLTKAKSNYDAAVKDVNATDEAIRIFEETFKVEPRRAHTGQWLPVTLHTYYHLDSRTDTSKPGHFIDLARTGAESTATCSCEAGQNGRQCWAVELILNNAKNGDSSWTISPSDFHIRRRPFSLTVRRPRLLATR